MASLDTLPSDQRAVLELVLRRGRTYDQIADMLSIDRAGVRSRALEAFDALGPHSRVPAGRRALITDYLLGALPDRVADEVRGHLAESAGERAWARVIASELEPIAAAPLPEIPVEGAAEPVEPTPVASEAALAEDELDEEPPARPAPRPRRPRPEPVRAPRRARPRPAGARGQEAPPRSSRMGGAVVLGLGGLVVLAVVLVLIFSGGSSHHATNSASRQGTHAASSSGSAGTPTATGSTGSTTSPQPLAQINLNPPTGGSAKGVAEVLRESGKTGIAIVAQGLAPNTTHPPNAYAVWLYNSPTDSHILGFVNPGVGKNGRLQTAGGLPSNASHYQKLLITLETQSNPKTPGQVVLEGTLVGVS